MRRRLKLDVRKSAYLKTTRSRRLAAARREVVEQHRDQQHPGEDLFAREVEDEARRD
jgi:hypothetical protein